MGDTVVFADEIFGFHVQQAAEKLFKTWLALSGVTYPAIHDLRRLLEMLEARQPDAARFDALIEYAPYAVQLRYSARDVQAEALDRGSALAQVEALLKTVRRQLAGAEDG